MSDDNNKNDLSVKTPWGNLVKSQGIQDIIDSLKIDLASFNKRLRDLERTKSSLPSLDLPGGSSSKVSTESLEQVKNELNSLSVLVNRLAKDNSSASSMQSVESMTKSLAHNLDSLKSDIYVMNKKVQELEKIKPQLTSSNPDPNVTRALSAFDKRIVMVENRMSELEAKFEKFSAKTIQILEQLRKG